MKYTCKEKCKTHHYSRATQYCLAELQRDGIQASTMLADYIEERHLKGLPTGYDLMVKANRIIAGAT